MKCSGAPSVCGVQCSTECLVAVVSPTAAMFDVYFMASLIPPRASEQGNVIRSVCIYMCVQKKIVIERTRDLIYLKVVVTDFFLKIISPSAFENSGDLA